MRENKTILVVDDEVPIRRIVEFKLGTAGYNILSAGDGQTGLEIIETQHPDAVVADIMMPGMNGRQLCERTDPIKTDRPFLTIVMTGRISPEEERWVSALRDTVFMEKPFSPSRLLEIVDKYFGETT